MINKQQALKLFDKGCFVITLTSNSAFTRSDSRSYFENVQCDESQLPYCMLCFTVYL